MKILLVEDDKSAATFIINGLKQAGFMVEHASEGTSGFQKAMSDSFDAAIVDIMLPKLDGLSLIKSLRLNKMFMPILILSAKSSVDDRIAGLEIGGDDYLVKPFAFSELLARVQALIRRAHSIAEPQYLTISDLSLDIQKHKVVRNNNEIDLQPKEYALLEYLMRNMGRVVSKTMIMENVWDYNFDPQTNVVEAMICRLREKIDRSFEKKLIHTIRGVGYVLEEKN